MRPRTATWRSPRHDRRLSTSVTASARLQGLDGGLIRPRRLVVHDSAARNITLPRGPDDASRPWRAGKGSSQRLIDLLTVTPQARTDRSRPARRDVGVETRRATIACRGAMVPVARPSAPRAAGQLMSLSFHGRFCYCSGSAAPRYGWSLDPGRRPLIVYGRVKLQRRARVTHDEAEDAHSLRPSRSSRNPEAT